MRRRVAIAALGLWLAGCGTDPGLWLRIEAPLTVPDQCDQVSVDVTRTEDGQTAFTHIYDLTNGPQFPLTLALRANSSSDVGPPLLVQCVAFQLGSPVAQGNGTATLTRNEMGQLVVQLTPL